MRSTLALTIAALAGSSLAAPSFSYYGGKLPKDLKPFENIKVVYETVVHTIYQPEGELPAPTPTPTPSPTSTPCDTPTLGPIPDQYYPAPLAPAPPPPAPVPEYHAAPPPAPVAPAPSPEPEYPAAPAPSAPSPPNNGYMAVVVEWRLKLGLPVLEWSGLLEGNANQTVIDGNGKMQHELFTGSLAQVLAPCDPEDFRTCFVGGWLCESPSLPGLDGICATMSAGWDYMGQTGHAKILTDPSKTKIGCGNHKNILCCDLA